MRVEDPVLSPNPYGIHYLRAAASLGLVAVHATAWILYLGGHRIDLFATSMVIIGSLVCVSSITPSVAGAAQALSLRDRFHGARLIDAPFKKTALLLLFLIFIEDLKASLFFGPGLFYSWNVTHLIAASLLITMALSSLSIYLVFLSVGLCIALTPALRRILHPFQVVSQETMRIIHQSTIPRDLTLISAALLALAVLFIVGSQPSLARRFKVRISLLLILAFGVFLASLSYFTWSPHFAVRILNLPVGLLVGDELGYHYWPMFPWYSVVAGGFLYFHLLMRTDHPRLVRSFLWSLTLVSLVVFYVFYRSAISAEMDPRNIWNQKLLTADQLSALLWAFGAFSLIALVSDALSTAAWMRAFIARNPLVFRIPWVFSRSIFWIYVFMNSAAILIAYPIAKTFSLGLAFTIYVPLIFYLSYRVGELAVSWMGTKRISIRLVRV